MGLLSEDAKRDQLIYGLVFGIACVIFIIAVAVLNIESEVMKDRFTNSQDLLDGNLHNLEYPPLVLVLIAIPRVFAGTPFGYSIGFVAEMFVFFVIGLLIVSKFAKRYGKDEKRCMLAYTVLMLIMIEFVVDRFDIVPAVLALAAVYCYVTKRYTLAFALLAMGTMIKIYPAVLFPVFMVPLIMDRNWNEILKGTGVFAVVSLAVIVPVLILQPEMLSEMISYHADRPLQIETIASSFIYPFAMLGLTDVWISDSTEFGSDNLRGTLPDAAASILTFVMIALVIVVCIIYAMILKKLKGMGSKDDRRYLFASTILIVVMMFVMIGKVFSSQYLLWIIPPLTVLLMISSDEKWNRIVFILFAVILAVTQLQFAYNVGYLGGGENINDIGMMMILLRNILMIALLYYVVKPICDRYLFTKRPAEPC